MIAIEIKHECRTKEDATRACEYVAALIMQGYTSGIEPAWSLTGEEQSDDDDNN
jgi:hypothetical protein